MNRFAFAAIILACAFLPFSAGAQSSACTHYSNATGDDNKVPDPSCEAGVIGPDIAIVDGNQSRGSLEISFELAPPAEKNPSGFFLIMNVPDMADSDSGDGFSVFMDGIKIGSAGKISRNGKSETSLDPALLKGKTRFTLIVKANGNDGFYVYRVHSRLGPVMSIAY